ncbi:MAG: hypothetical protein Kow00109_25350 [Acidobacteriota bacterium]
MNENDLSKHVAGESVQSPEVSGGETADFGTSQVAEAIRQSPWFAGLFPVGEERRAAPRYLVSAKVQLTVFLGGPGGWPDGGNRKLERTAFTRDLSSGGACLVLEEPLGALGLNRIVGRNVKLKMKLSPGDEEAVHLLGRVVWGKQQGGDSLLGVQFTDVPPAERALLERYCRENEGEMSRLTNLWELLVAGGEEP